MKNLNSFAFFLSILSIGMSSCSPDDAISEIGEVTFEEPRIILDNNGVHSWNVMEVTGTGVSKAFEDKNQTLTLRIGLRYTFVNLGSRDHPLEFRNATGELLFSQDLYVGSFENDPEVDFQYDINEELAVFTLTEKLAKELATYNCSFHEMMEGSILLVK
jgi:hypothetical protein